MRRCKPNSTIDIFLDQAAVAIICYYAVQQSRQLRAYAGTKYLDRTHGGMVMSHAND